MSDTRSDYTPPDTMLRDDRASTELLGMELAGPITPGQMAQLERVRASSRHLLGLIEDHFIRSPSGRYYHALSFVVRGTVGERPDPAWRQDHSEIIEVRWADPRELTANDVRRLHWDLLAREGFVVP